MSREELELAQHLLGVYRSSHRWADRLDPERARREPLARMLDGITKTAGTAFFAVVGRIAGMVAASELNPENPAPWTQLPRNERNYP